MSFVSISLKKYIKLHLKNNPGSDEKELKRNLLAALKDFKSGKICDCGNDIWVIGSAFVGNKCFTCITGESNPGEDFELAEALPKRNKSIPGLGRGNYFYDDGSEFNPDLYPKPNLCLNCKKNDDPGEEMLCNLNRMDQIGEKEFKCFAYESKEK